MAQRMSLVLTSLLCSSLVACGVTNTANSPGASTTGSTIAATTTATGSTFPATSTVGSTPTTAGKVTITVQQHSNDIAATIQNGNTAAIKVADHESNCTILTLQMQANGNWTNRAACTSTTALNVIDIAAGASLSVDLGAKALDTGAAWGPGTYRLQMQFALSANSAPGPADKLYTANSAMFTLS